MAKMAGKDAGNDATFKDKNPVLWDCLSQSHCVPSHVSTGKSEAVILKGSDGARGLVRTVGFAPPRTGGQYARC